jgi:hypothetical protein
MRNCWSCEKKPATEPSETLSQCEREDTKGLCDNCRALNAGQPVSIELLYASTEDFSENIWR